MSTPRLEVRLDLIEHNARTVVERLRPLGIAVSGVTKASLGDPLIASAMLAGGVSSLSDSRIENIERLREGGITGEIMLIRSPMLSQTDRVVDAADVSMNTEMRVLEGLSRSAWRRGRTHGVIVMVELGDLREGVMPDEAEAMISRTQDLRSLVIRGIGANLACQSGVIPDAANMTVLSDLACSIERSLGLHLDIVSGGNSANLGWAMDGRRLVGRVNHLRLGESILLGRDPVDRSPIAGLDAGAFTVVGEVIEAKAKPPSPWGSVGQTAFGEPLDLQDRAEGRSRIIVALGRQDLDVDGITAPPPLEVLGASSDHLILGTTLRPPPVGSEVRVAPTYGTLLRAMTSPSVSVEHLEDASGAPSPLRHRVHQSDW